MPCNQQGTPIHVYSQGAPKAQPSSQYLYYTVAISFTQSLPLSLVQMNSTTRIYPLNEGFTPSSSYYDFDMSLSGNYHPSRLLNTQSMGKDTFLTLLPKASPTGRFAGTLLSMSLYDRVIISLLDFLKPLDCRRHSVIKKLIRICSLDSRTLSL
jgi:hypothetical protein